MFFFKYKNTDICFFTSFNSIYCKFIERFLHNNQRNGSYVHQSEKEAILLNHNNNEHFKHDDLVMFSVVNS